jgi:hypothetical protein
MMSWLVQAPVWQALVRRHHASPPRPIGAVGRGEFRRLLDELKARKK